MLGAQWEEVEAEDPTAPLFLEVFEVLEPDSWMWLVRVVGEVPEALAVYYQQCSAPLELDCTKYYGLGQGRPAWAPAGVAASASPGRT